MLAQKRHSVISGRNRTHLDLGELDSVFEGRWLWSTEAPNLAWFRRADHYGDHYGDPKVPLSDAIRDLVAERTGVRPAGPIRLLTHLRYFGHCFNPVSFYYCFGYDGRTVETIVAEVSRSSLAGWSSARRARRERSRASRS